MKTLYFGCIGQSGHYMFNEHGHHIYGAEGTTPWGATPDGTLCYGRKDAYNNGPQEQGLAVLHHKDGWTALSFWDRSVDKRGGCNSNFFAEGTYGPADMINICKEMWPQVWSRFTFEVRVIERPSEIIGHKYNCWGCKKWGVGADLKGWSHPPPGWFKRDDKPEYACSVECVTKLEGA